MDSKGLTANVHPKVEEWAGWVAGVGGGDIPGNSEKSKGLRVGAWGGR